MSPDATVAEVRRRLCARPERVFSAFANAEIISRWLTPSPEIKLAVLEFDFRVGGAYRFAYQVSGGQKPVRMVRRPGAPGTFRPLA
jgi:uncharacterized protein YndB with AHSA1/START domain